VRKLLIAVAASLLIAGTVLATPALAGNGGLSPVPPNAPGAKGITDIYWFVTVFIGAVFVAVEGLLVVFIVRYRRRKRARDADGLQIHGSTRLETMWTAIPVVILVAIATFVFVKLPGIKNTPVANAAGT